MRLHLETGPAWVEAVLADFDAFLLDHAACERKAAATADKLIAQYPSHQALVGAMRDLSLEELHHFTQVRRVIEARRLGATPYYRDPYVAGLTAAVRKHHPDHLLDRLLVSGVIEARACERLGLVAGALPPGELRDLYRELTCSEARHHGLFVRLAKTYYDEAPVRARLHALLELEASIVAALPVRPAIH